jgi:hypothetical protein
VRRAKRTMCQRMQAGRHTRERLQPDARTHSTHARTRMERTRLRAILMTSSAFLKSFLSWYTPAQLMYLSTQASIRSCPDDQGSHARTMHTRAHARTMHAHAHARTYGQRTRAHVRTHTCTHAHERAQSDRQSTQAHG